MTVLLIDYECPKCSHRWQELWESACDSTCPECLTRDVQAWQWDAAPESTRLTAALAPVMRTTLEAIINTPANANSEPDVMANALETITDRAQRVLSLLT